MIWLTLTILFITFLSSFLRIKLWIYSLVIVTIQLCFLQFDFISYTLFFIIFTPTLFFLLLLNLKKMRIKFITQNLYNYLKNSNNQWDTFRRIDNGWFASDFEKAIFNGQPIFSNTIIKVKKTKPQARILAEINQIIIDPKLSTNTKTINRLSDIGATSLLIKNSYNGEELSAYEISNLLKNISKNNPVLATIIGLMNLDSLTSFIHHFASYNQKKKFLPMITEAKMIPFLKPTSLYETLESQKSSIEGRVEKEFIKGKEQIGIRISFQDVILLGTTRSNCFYLNVNVKDYNNLHGKTTHLGTAICIINKEIKGISYRKGLKAYDFLHYYACTGQNIFIPFYNIINEAQGIGKGLEYLYRNQYFASSIWPLAVSIPANNTATLTAWYFAHLQKQNGRQLLSFKVVQTKLNEQISQSLHLKLMNEISLSNNLDPPLLKFTAILNKNMYISQTMEQLSLLRGILGSNSHNIKTESKLRSFYKVAHLTTELDGMSHEINQLPLIRKAALACHPYYYKEVELLIKDSSESRLKEFDKLIFQHIGYILQNISKTWVQTLRFSTLGKLILPKNKYKSMIKSMSSSFAFLSDITLIVWAFKLKINTSFASHLGESIQHLTTSIALHNHYASSDQNKQTKELTKVTLKNTLYLCQNALKNTINLAFGRGSALFIKFLIFPLGRPFHEIKTLKTLNSDIEEICEFDPNTTNGDLNTSYSPFLKRIYDAKQKLQAAKSAEIAVSNVTGTPLTTDNYETLINRCLAAGIVSVEQSEQLRDAYQSILAIQLTNHFGNNYEKNYDR